LREAFPYIEGKKLPNGWVWKQLGGNNGIADIVNGATPSTDEPSYWNGAIPWVTPTDIGKINSMYLQSTERKITQAGYDSCSTTIVPANSILMTSRAPVGNMVINNVPVCTNQGFKSIVPKEGINTLFLFFYLQRIVQDIQKNSHGNTFTEIGKEKVEKIKIPMPLNHHEQTKIGENILNKTKFIFTLRETIKTQNEVIEALLSAILRQTFTIFN
jgi:type I restriction enzyme, S subunit